jgi:mono/diheme cytochrome c family protein
MTAHPATLYHRSQMRTRFPLSFLVLLAGAAGLTAMMAGCRSLPASKPEALWTVQEGRGAIVFNQKCAKCHYPTTTRGLHGPGLQAMTKIKAMPSGAPPTDERIIQTIVRGHGLMPGTQITDDQLTDLMAYLHTL